MDIEKQQINITGLAKKPFRVTVPFEENGEEGNELNRHKSIRRVLQLLIETRHIPKNI